MDPFRLHHGLSNIRAVLLRYPPMEEIAQEIAQLLEQMRSRRYRVAVIGEFKRGKSSLVNALLGVEALPTNCLPTTAVINRVVYDTQQKIVIHYKNGGTEEQPIGRLREYATKTDKEKEARALTIRSIDVHYPSVFNRGGIELLDTPGLNEHETMTETTLSVLDEIDTAVVVLHAAMPLSLSEQDLIGSLIEQRKIYHLTFAVSFIDAVSDDPCEQDQVIDFIADRLRGETYDRFCAAHDDPQLRQKAAQILKAPKVFGVSAKTAMRGFIQNDETLVRRSRFAQFKTELTAFLTAAQEEDTQRRAEQIARDVRGSFPQRHDAYVRQLRAQAPARTEQAQDDFIRNSKREMAVSMAAMEQALQAAGFSPDPRNAQGAKPVSACCRIANTPLPGSVAEKQEKMWLALAGFKLEVTALADEWMRKITDTEEARRQCVGLPPDAMRSDAARWAESHPAPSLGIRKETLYQWVADDPAQACRTIAQKFCVYQQAFFDYCAAWRKCLLLRNRADVEALEAMAAASAPAQAEADALERDYDVNLRILNEAADGILSQSS